MRFFRAIGRGIAATWHWLGGPWRSLKAFCIALINMDRRQMRSLFSIAMLGGIIALSIQNMVLIALVRDLLGQVAGTLFGNMVTNQQLWNNIIILVFCVSLALIVWGADYFTAKYRGLDISAGSSEAEARVAAARRVAEAAAEEKREIEDEAEPVKATVADNGDIVPDDNFEENTR